MLTVGSSCVASLRCCRLKEPHKGQRVPASDPFNRTPDTLLSNTFLLARVPEGGGVGAGGLQACCQHCAEQPIKE